MSPLSSTIPTAEPQLLSNNKNSFAKKVGDFFSTIGCYPFTYPDFLPSLLDRSIQANQTQPTKSFLRALGVDFFGIDNSLEKEREEILAIVNQWISEGPPNEQEFRIEAKEEIEYFLYHTSQYFLKLDGLHLTTLPDIWGYPTFSENLRGLLLSRNKFQVFPVSIKQLTNLIDLCFSNNQLEEIPEAIGGLTALKELDLRKNKIRVFPETINQLAALQKLNLSGNQLQAIPESIVQITALQYLELCDNELQALPESIGRLTALLELNLFNNQLQTVPSSLGQLRNLSCLTLNHNRSLTSLPEEILTLPSFGRIEIENCGLSAQVLARLEEQCNAPGYTGPRFFFSMEHTEARAVDTRTVDELLDSLYQIAGKTRRPFSEEFTSSRDLQDWLSRIFYMADFNANQGAKRAEVAHKVLNLLELAADPNHSEFHDVFLGTVANATRSCGDSMSLSLLHLGIAKKLILVDPNDLQGLAALLLRGSWTLSQLEEFARNKVQSLRFVDEIEVYLGYPIMLKEQLAIPIDVDEMLYFRCSRLKEKDLQLAEEIINANLQDKNKVCDFLSSNNTWVKALDKLGLLEKLKAVRTAREENSTSNEEDLTIAAEYKQQLTETTKNILFFTNPHSIE